VGQARLPQLADDHQALVDDRVIHRRLADLGGPVEELAHHQVLALWGELHDAIRLWAGYPGALHQRQGVVLLLDKPTHGVERLLVLQPPIQQGPAELVPAVGPQVAASVQLGEQPGVLLPLDLDTQRGRAGRALPAEGLDVLHDDAELVVEGPADRLTATPPHIQVGAAAAAVGHWEDLVWAQQPEGDQRNHHTDDDRDHDAG
jgi:hypothetical protein